MFKIINDNCYFVEVNGDIDLSDPFINNYYMFLKKSKKSDSTIKKYIGSIHKFWIYNIYFLPKEDADYEDYILEYWSIIRKTGFKIELSREPFSKKPVILYEYSMIQNSAIEMVALEGYYKFLLNKQLNKNSHFLDSDGIWVYIHGVNIAKMKNSEKHSKGSGYGLKARGLTREILKESVANRLTIFTQLKKIGRASTKSAPPSKYEKFPFDAFRLFLDSVDNLRDRLLYLFCGATSARIGQALWLTIYDIDTKDREVYLTDPRSYERPLNQDGIPFMNQKPRCKLLLEHGINPNKGPFKKIGFKYPIPERHQIDRTLMFMTSELKDMFFELYFEWKKKGMNPDSIFIFQTSKNNKSGLLSYSNARDSFLTNTIKFDKFYPQYKIKYLSNVFHSFRHMWATFMADVAYMRNFHLGENALYELPNGDKQTPFEIYKEFVSKKMGHSSASSTDRYFNISREINKFSQQKINEDLKHYLDLRNTIIESLKPVEIGY
jgi:integrase